MTAPACTLPLATRSADTTVAAADAYLARPRFTVDGDGQLETQLTVMCERIAAGLRGLLPARKLEAVLLGGGYGRGEGGVLHTADGDRPYNDLEFYVFLRGNRHLNQRLHGRAVHVLGEILTPQAGVEVEFHLASRRELAAADVTMFSYDLMSGHRCVVGDESLFKGCAHHREAEAVPVAEATRLMMNRCTGLLLAKERLLRATFTPADADFVARNIAKARLGAGDAVLTAFAQYHWSVRERHRRLDRLVRSEHSAWMVEVGAHHAQGVEFKLHPTRSSAGRHELNVEHALVTDFCREVWLWLEERRLKGRFSSITAYAEPAVRKCESTSALRNVLVNANAFGPAALAMGGATRHPRERVLNALPLLLWHADALASPALLRRLQAELRTTASDFPAMTAAYRDLWAKVN